MKKFFDKFQTLKGVSFVGLNNYKKENGEISNHTINVGLSIDNAKKSDLNKLSNLPLAELAELAKDSNLSDYLIGYLEMSIAAKINLSENKTAQSKGQTDAYIHLTPAIKMNKKNMIVYIFGQSIAKKIVTPGTYVSVESSGKTLAKKAIHKYLGLHEFRNFNIGNLEAINIMGETIVMP